MESTGQVEPTDSIVKSAVTISYIKVIADGMWFDERKKFDLAIIKETDENPVDDAKLRVCQFYVCMGIITKFHKRFGEKAFYQNLNFTESPYSNFGLFKNYAKSVILENDVDFIEEANQQYVKQCRSANVVDENPLF
jgi:hypothetical protein